MCVCSVCVLRIYVVVKGMDLGPASLCFFSSKKLKKKPWSSLPLSCELVTCPESGLPICFRLACNYFFFYCLIIFIFIFIDVRHPESGLPILFWARYYYYYYYFNYFSFIFISIFGDVRYALNKVYPIFVWLAI